MSGNNTATGDYNFSANALPKGTLGFPETLDGTDERLAFSTTPIRYADEIYGTGFFLQPTGGPIFVVTCGHVMTEIIEAHPSQDMFSYELRLRNGEVRQQKFGISDILMHQDGQQQVDLVAIRVPGTGLGLKICRLNLGMIADDLSLKATRFMMETVMMFGYPTGLYDVTNSLPLMRIGHTASHPGIDFNADPEGRLNITGYHVDSGAPVFLVPRSSFYNKVTKQHLSVVGDIPYVFLGIYYGGESTHSHYGFKDIPDDDKLDSPMAIGCYLKAKLLRGIQQWVPYVYEKMDDAADTESESDKPELEARVRVLEEMVSELRELVKTQGQSPTGEKDSKSGSLN